MPLLLVAHSYAQSIAVCTIQGRGAWQRLGPIQSLDIALGSRGVDLGTGSVLHVSTDPDGRTKGKGLSIGSGPSNSRETQRNAQRFNRPMGRTRISSNTHHNR